MYTGKQRLSGSTNSDMHYNRKLAIGSFSVTCFASFMCSYSSLKNGVRLVCIIYIVTAMIVAYFHFCLEKDV